MTNENCLAGIKCPNCQQEDRFHIGGLATFEVTDDGSEAVGDHEWDNESACQCSDCGKTAELVWFRPADAETISLRRVLPCVRDGNSVDRPAEGQTAMFWGIYQRKSDGTEMLLADFDTEIDAQAAIGLAEMPVRDYSVLLLYPDYLADNYGEDTYFTHIKATSPRMALEMAQQEACDAQQAEVIDDAADFAALLVLKGRHEAVA